MRVEYNFFVLVPGESGKGSVAFVRVRSNRDGRRSYLETVYGEGVEVASRQCSDQ